MNKVNNVVIVGGGTAGWITASLLSRVLGKIVNIKLIESDKIASVGVGEATIPAIISLNAALGINEADFLKATNGTIKLGIQFENWKRQGDSYMHAFGGIGKNFPFCDFYHYWLRQQKSADSSDDFWDFSLNYQAAKRDKFSKVRHIEGTQLPGITYAYHFDATLYAQYLRKIAQNNGVQRIEATINQVHVNRDSGFVDSVELENGQQVSADLFVDCTGMSGLLIDKALNTGYVDWSHYLPCDRAIAVQCEGVEPISPYTRSIAHQAGWQWRIPLQHRIGNGIVYSSKFISDEQAKQTLLANLDGKPLTEPKVIEFRTGRRVKQWNKNVVAIGLSSGFLEPLESTSIHLIQTAAIRLIKTFPHHGIEQQNIDEFNRQSIIEIERIRDFIILHYKVNQRDDSAFWRQCQRMDIPASLQRKIDLFKKTGKLFREQDDLFTEIAWQQVFIGQGLLPDDHHPLADQLSQQQLTELMANLKVLIDRTVDKMPSHDHYLSQL
ncbi:tryptophan 7-halogenase [Thalassotalea ponticola]|uniref:tryptophan halogenase family protein n=1 Tax=Thalassotalea ponticola TaxID=1523392 RepID=UPI0025B5E444|nr:tryptophan halogenase family protein [Thalassotalea ponticola]MDN3652495.1 tryptophan 7-halogenase [Thalassotalea ponticola]